MKQIKVSVITVVFNGVKTIENTINSVISQTYDNFEYIIIDGGSNDGTIDVVNKYKKSLSCFISENDNGIYDAMNKGVANAIGEWLIFMNSGDTFFNTNVLGDVFSQSFIDIGVIYGSVNCYDKFKNIIIEPKPINCIKNSMVFCHQSSFIRTSILKQNLFDLNYKIAADYNLFYNLYLQGIKFVNCNVCIANYEVENGLSSKNGYLGAKENLLITGKWGVVIHMIPFYYQTLIFYIGYYLKKILPKKLIKIYFNFKYFK